MAEYEAVVGATFAYFTASTSTAGTAPTTNVKTTELKGATVTFDSTASKFELLNYPGGIAVYGAQASIEKQQEGDTNDYEATFNLKIDYINQTNTALDWELWMVESQVDNLNASTTTTCKFRQQKDDVTGETKYWYSDSDSTPLGSDKGCTAQAITSKISSELSGTKLAHGQLKSNPEGTEQHITKSDLDSSTNFADNGDLEQRKINTSDKQSKYYYLVVKYPNENSSQDTDMEKQIKVTLSIDGQPASTIYNG